MWVNVMICDACWERANPGRKPVRVKASDEMNCDDCGDLTSSGIYRRKNQDSPPHPAVLSEAAVKSLIGRIIGSGTEVTVAAGDATIESFAEEVRPVARAIMRSGQATAEFADSLKAVGVLIPKQSMTKEMLEPLVGAAIDSLVERLISIKASFAAPPSE